MKGLMESLIKVFLSISLKGTCTYLIVVTKKPSMKELTKKERKNVRKTMKTNFDQINRSKKIWEELRRYILFNIGQDIHNF